MKYRCRYCNCELEGEWPDPYGPVEDGDLEQELWGHIQMAHPEIFEEAQDWETGTMLEECYIKE